MLQEPELQSLELDVVDLRFNETRFCQRARPASLTLTFLDNGCVQLLLQMRRQAFGVLPDGTPGDPVPAGYLQLAPAELLANSAVAVSAAGTPGAGFPRYRLRSQPLGDKPGSAFNTLTQQVEEFAPGQDWLGFLRAKPEQLVLQDRYFGQLCQDGQVNISQLLQAYAAQADAAPSVFAVQ